MSRGPRGEDAAGWGSAVALRPRVPGGWLARARPPGAKPSPAPSEISAFGSGTAQPGAEYVQILCQQSEGFVPPQVVTGCLRVLQSIKRRLLRESKRARFAAF